MIKNGQGHHVGPRSIILEAALNTSKITLRSNRWLGVNLNVFIRLLNLWKSTHIFDETAILLSNGQIWLRGG